MNSNNEEYLDSLLNSAKSNNDNPQSALSRMASKGKGDNSAFDKGSNAEDIGALVENSSNNEDLKEIGDILGKLDRDELVDDKMASLLNDIEKPISSDVPAFTVGNTPSIDDVRDPEEIALDEAIADAERMDAEIQSGKISVPKETIQEKTPIIDESEQDNSLLEMAPEMIMPEDNAVEIDKESNSDADQTPEEILTDLLDEDPDNNNLVEHDISESESLSALLDNMQDYDEVESVGETAEVIKENIPEDIQEVKSNEMDLDSIDIDNLSLDDLEAAMDQAVGADIGDDSSNKTGVTDNDELVEKESAENDVSAENNLDNTDFEGIDTDVNMPDSNIENDSFEESSAGEASAEESSGKSTGSLDGLSDDFNLDDLEASLDDLLNEDNNSANSTDGEVAGSGTGTVQNQSGDSEDISMPDLDALMNSLANDEVEDIENTAHLENDPDIPKEDILDALTENLDDGTDPSLDELASIPDKDTSEDETEEAGDGKKGKKEKKKKGEKKEGFFARLLKALTAEDEEENADGEGLASLTDENQQVLKELGEEGAKSKKEKKKKEKKPKKEKPKKEPKPKKEKPPKPKKEKKPKPPKDPDKPEKAISPKKVAISFIFAASLGILCIIPALVLPEQISNNRALNAFNQREYTTAYKLLYGKDKDEEQNYIYEQSRVLAWAQRYLSGYQNYSAMNMKEEALDMLLMAMRNKDSLLEEASKYGVENQVQSVYDNIESLLSESYGLSSEDIEEINSIKKERDYTIRLMEIVGTLES